MSRGLSVIVHHMSLPTHQLIPFNYNLHNNNNNYSNNSNSNSSYIEHKNISNQNNHNNRNYNHKQLQQTLVMSVSTWGLLQLRYNSTEL